MVIIPIIVVIIPIIVVIIPIIVVIIPIIVVIIPIIVVIIPIIVVIWLYDGIYIYTNIHYWLVVEPPTPLKNDGVSNSWDDDIPNMGMDQYLLIKLIPFLMG